MTCDPESARFPPASGFPPLRDFPLVLHRRGEDGNGGGGLRSGEIVPRRLNRPAWILTTQATCFLGGNRAESDVLQHVSVFCSFSSFVRNASLRGM
jgi:hypothetical protein